NLPEVDTVFAHRAGHVGSHSAHSTIGTTQRSVALAVASEPGGAFDVKPTGVTVGAGGPDVDASGAAVCRVGVAGIHALRRLQTILLDRVADLGAGATAVVGREALENLSLARHRARARLRQERVAPVLALRHATAAEVEVLAPVALVGAAIH